MITVAEPSTWQELEEGVGQILSECGFSVEVEKRIKTARGWVEVDVYAEEAVKGRCYVVVCECKHWMSGVPQAVIHSFRSVLADFGAHKGYVISKSGFQSGAREAANLTNVELVTWQEFQEAFEQSWFDAFFVPELKKLNLLIDYTGPFGPDWMRDRPEADFVKARFLRDRYSALGRFVLFVRHSLPHSSQRLSLPLAAAMNSRWFQDWFSALPPEMLATGGFRELLQLVMAEGGKAIEEFHAVRDEGDGSPHNGAWEGR
jgi:restriction system protein